MKGGEQLLERSETYWLLGKKHGWPNFREISKESLGAWEGAAIPAPEVI